MRQVNGPPGGPEAERRGVAFVVIRPKHVCDLTPGATFSPCHSRDAPRNAPRRLTLNVWRCGHAIQGVAANMPVARKDLCTKQPLRQLRSTLIALPRHQP